MRHGDLKNFTMTHQHTEANIISPKNEKLSWNPTTRFAEPLLKSTGLGPPLGLKFNFLVEKYCLFLSW